MLDRLFKRPPAGLSLVERAKTGSQSAQDLVIKTVETEAPPSGLSLAEMAKLGLESAKIKVNVIYEASGIKTDNP